MHVLQMDPRGIAAMRILICLISIGEILFVWGPEMFQGGILSEEVLPRYELLSIQPGTFSLYLAAGTSTTKLLIAAVHVVLLVKLMVGHGDNAFTALLVWIFSISLHQRNMAVTFGHQSQLDRCLLSLVLLPSNATWSWSLDHHSQTNTRAQSQSHHWGGRLFALVVFFSMWTMHGWEKLIEYEYWWHRGDALLLSLHSDVAYPFAKAMAEMMVVFLPQSMNVCICRFILLIECPVGPAMLLVPFSFVRTIGMILISTSLLSFGIFLSVDMLPWSCLSTALPLFPTACWDWVEEWRGARNRVVLIWSGTKEKKDPRDNQSDAHQSDAHQSDAHQSVPGVDHQRSEERKKTNDTKKEAVQNILGVAGSCLMLFCAVRMSMDTHGNQHVPIIHSSVDPVLLSYGIQLRLGGGWKAFTPPPMSNSWYVAVGVTRKPTRWVRSERGVAVRFYDALGDWVDEGKPFDDVSWKPPSAHLTDLRVSFIASHAYDLWTRTLMYDTRYVTARTKTIVDLCNGFHERHSALDERLDRVEVWELNRPFWNDVYQAYNNNGNENGRVIFLSSIKAEPTKDSPLLAGDCK